MSETVSVPHESLLARIARLGPGQRARLEQRLLEMGAADAAAADGGDRLLAYVSVTPGAAQPSVDELRRHLAGRLPAFMVPSAFEFVTDLPRLPNGKINRRALVAPGDVASAPAAAPGVNRIEAQVMRIWGELVDLGEIGLDDNFFELGGHSLLVPRLVDRLQMDFGVTLPLGAVFRSPTVRGLAALVEAGQPAQTWKSLVAIRDTGRRPPLYMVHGLGGEIGYFYNLANHLHAEQPVYALQAPVEPFNQIERMAAHYLSEIREHQPTGPYYLGGYCVGGCVAYEMARQLQDAGESVKLLAIVDSVMPGPQSRWTRLRRFFDRPAAKQKEAIARRVRNLLNRSEHRDEDAAPPDTVPSIIATAPTAYREAVTRHYEAQLHYAPRPYAGNMCLFRSENQELDRDLGWGLVVRGRLEIRQVPGPHEDVLMEPYLKETARQISEVVDAAMDER
jgi:thioesterase domain-containing protein/acyl carrier protein